MTNRGKIEEKVCRVCGASYTSSRKNSRTCSPHCSRINSSHSKGINNKSLRGGSITLSPVLCKCPACEEMHTVKMAPVRPGFVPRIYHPECAESVKRRVNDAYSADPAYMMGI